MGLPIEKLTAQNKKARVMQSHTFESFIANTEEGERYELHNGVPYLMAKPSTRHQIIASRLHGNLFNLLEDRNCVVLYETGVCLFGMGKQDKNYFEPDIIVVCEENLENLDENYYNGAPEFVIEILSPSTSSRDYILKRNKYKEAGVREYWIVDPHSDAKNISVFLLEEDYEIREYSKAGKVAITALGGCEIDLTKIFTEE